ncbi:MAG TPA: MBL fold metallo-hydrolase [Xanthobacteraceae bacterium]|jgi:ribonuclease Z
MRPLLHPTLVNGRTGDPALYMETLFERRAILFDLGDISALPPRKVQRIERIFVSHAHVDHFIGFDRLLRLLVGRERSISLYGPEGFVEHVQHKLHAYLWNLADRYSGDLVFTVTQIASSLATDTSRFRLKRAFSREEIGSGRIADGVLHQDPSFRIKAAVLDHGTPCLGFAIEEPMHVNVWKSRLVARQLPVGPWLRELKNAVVESLPDDHPITVRSRPRSADERALRLADLRDLVTVTPGQKIAYVTDIADNPANRAAVIALSRNADLLFIEAAFAQADEELARQRGHLTTAAAGEIARQAGARRVEPFHFSSRYPGEEERLLAEVRAAFGGPAT